MSRNATLARLRAHWHARWATLAPREQALASGAAALVLLALLWSVLLGPSLGLLRSAETRHQALDAQLRQMQAMQAQARALQAQPQPKGNDAMALLQGSLAALGPGAQLASGGDRATLTLTGVPGQAVAAWLAEARLQARAVPAEARLSRNPAGQWDGTVVLTLPR